MIDVLIVVLMLSLIVVNLVVIVIVMKYINLVIELLELLETVKRDKAIEDWVEQEVSVEDQDELLCENVYKSTKVK